MITYLYSTYPVFEEEISKGILNTSLLFKIYTCFTSLGHVKYAYLC